MKTELEVAYNRMRSRTNDTKEFISQLEDITHRIGVVANPSWIRQELESTINQFKRKMEL